MSLSLGEATLQALSIPGDKMPRWKPAFAPCLSLPAPALHGSLKHHETAPAPKYVPAWLTQSRPETRGLKTAHEENAIRLTFKPCLQALRLKNNTHRWPCMFSSLGAFFPAGMQGLDGLLRLCGDSTSALQSDHYSPLLKPRLDWQQRCNSRCMNEIPVCASCPGGKEGTALQDRLPVSRSRTSELWGPQEKHGWPPTWHHRQ